MYSQAEENYLKALLKIIHVNGEASVNQLSKDLDIKMPTVNSMMKKLAEKQLVHYESYKPVRLTPAGKKAAALILRKHRLTEMFLVEIMGFGWEEVHPIAEQIEHIQSPLFFEKMDDILNHPSVDPHGSPIPDKSGHLPQLGYTPLSACKEKDKVTFQAVADSSEDFLRFLNKKEMQLGMTMKVVHIEPFDGSMEVEWAGTHREILSTTACNRILVTVNKK